MGKPPVEEKKITLIDIRIAVSVLICLLTAEALNCLGLKIIFGNMQLEVIQHLTAAISCLLVCQQTVDISKKAAVNRLIITAIGGLLGILVTLLDTLIHNGWILAVMTAVGVLLSLFLCKCARVPYVNARIGGVTCVLVAGTLSGNARILYAVLRFVSTFYGALVSVIVTAVFAAFWKETKK